MKKENKVSILDEMVKKQKKEIKPEFRLNYKDLTRISSKINESIFNNKCCLWEGYVTNLYNPKKGRYVNFYFNKKKQPLHRLIYNNFKGSLEKGEYLKYSCCNNGYCLNVNHMEKVFNSIPKKEKVIEDIELPNDTKVKFD
jgi:hypothetical protein